MLTERQQEILDFIREQQSREGVTPSTREIQEHFGFASKTAAVGHLDALKRKGALISQPGKARALVLADAPRRAMLAVPIYGTIPAGVPVDQQQDSDGCVLIDPDTLRLPKGARIFALRVGGDSMTNAGILDGDLVMLEHREPRSGDIVAALIDNESTLKRYVVQRGRPFLKAENPKYKDLIPAQELVIQGVMVLLHRVVKK